MDDMVDKIWKWGQEKEVGGKFDMLISPLNTDKVQDPDCYKWIDK